MNPNSPTPTRPLLHLFLGLAAAGAALAAEPSRLTNLSIRAAAGSGSEPLIAGFSLGGADTKPVLLRAIGPTLSTLGVSDAAADPELRLFNGATLIGSNNDWGGASDLAGRFSALGAFPLPGNSRDAVLLQSLGSGAYSAHVTATGPGTVLLECYDADPNATGLTLRNISARAFVTPESPLTAGFTLTGTAPKLILARGVGPTLSRFNVPNPLPNPLLRIHTSAGALSASVDDWTSSATATAIVNAVGAFPLTDGSRDAATVFALRPGSYTVQVSSADQQSGVALVELYEVTLPGTTHPSLQPVSNAFPTPPALPAGTRIETLARLASTPTAGVVYPADLRGSGITGEVIASFLVSESGQVSDPVIVSANDARFGNAVSAWVTQLRYEPARTNTGQAVPVRIIAPFIFLPPAS